MLKKLRRKFVAVVMGVAAVILLAVFAVLVISTETGMRRQSEEMLERELNRRVWQGGGWKEENKNRVELPPEGKNPNEVKIRFPCFTVLVEKNGTVNLGNRAEILLSDLDTAELKELAREVALREEPSGALSARRLRYAKRTGANGTIIAFADSTAEYNSLAELLKNSFLIGALTLLIFFCASILLARWAVRPVENAWNQQKQFVGDASHELKTPLTVILSNAEMIVSHPEEDPARWANNILAEAQRMKGLTQELLTLARSEDSAHAPVMEQVDLSYLVTDSVLSFEPAAFESGHELSQKIKPGLLLPGNAAGLSQLCGILLENALQYASPSGKIQVELRAVGKTARLSVSNEGTPIPPEELPRIFERFYRGDPSRHGEGHGLSLAIARQLAALHKGKIWAESGEKKNTFFVTLPGVKPDRGRGRSDRST